MQQQALPEGQKAISEESINQLITVLAEIEDRILSEMNIQVRLRQNLEAQRNLQPIYEELFGTETRRGSLQTQQGRR